MRRALLEAVCGVLTSIMVLAVAVTINACDKGNSRASPGAVAQAPTVKKAAEQMGPPIATIKTEARAIAQEAPQVEHRTDRIDAAAGDLLVIQSQLEDAYKMIASSEKECDQLRVDLKKARDDLVEERSKQNTTLKWVLRGLATAAVLGTALCLWGGSFKLATFGMVLFGTAISGSVLLDWAKPIAVGVLVCLGALAVYLFVTRQKGLAKVVTFADKIKTVADVDAIERIGREVVNDPTTKAIVKRLRKPKTLTWWQRLVAWCRARLAKVGLIHT